jgi:hypothetical protein
LAIPKYPASEHGAFGLGVVNANATLGKKLKHRDVKTTPTLIL